VADLLPPDGLAGGAGAADALLRLPAPSGELAPVGAPAAAEPRTPAAGGAAPRSESQPLPEASPAPEGGDGDAPLPPATAPAGPPPAKPPRKDRRRDSRDRRRDRDRAGADPDAGVVGGRRVDGSRASCLLELCPAADAAAAVPLAAALAGVPTARVVSALVAAGAARADAARLAEGHAVAAPAAAAAARAWLADTGTALLATAGCPDPGTEAADAPAGARPPSGAVLPLPPDATTWAAWHEALSAAPRAAAALPDGAVPHAHTAAALAAPVPAHALAPPPLPSDRDRGGGEGGGGLFDPAAPAAAPPPPPALARAASARARPGDAARIDYALLAGRGRAPAPVAARRDGAFRGEGEGGPAGAAAAAVAACVAAGGAATPLDAQWPALAAAGAVMAAAPADELEAELIALQAELGTAAAAHRARAAAALSRAATALADDDAARSTQASQAEYGRAFVARLRAARRAHKRAARDAAARAAAAAAADAAPGPRPRGGATLPPDDALTDHLAARAGDEDAMCAVCGFGESAPPNLIVFCERCDVAVHQGCYGVGVVPEHEWLCWPCREHEVALAASGVPRDQVRPPRWATAGAGAPPGGGSLDTTCALCPVRRGAFRRTVDGAAWVHVPCALWHLETGVRAGPACAAVTGVTSVRADRRGVRCSECGRTEGAVVRCAQAGCGAPCHPLCARNHGGHLSMAPAPGSSRRSYRIFCPLHGEAAAARDAALYEADMPNLPPSAPRPPPASGSRDRERERHNREARLAAAAASRGAGGDPRLAAAAAALAPAEAANAALHGARLELEALRLIIERVLRRERVKRAAAAVAGAWWQAALAHPAAGAPALAAREAAAAAAPPRPRDSSPDDPGGLTGDARAKRARLRGGSPAPGGSAGPPPPPPPRVSVDTAALMTPGQAAAANGALPPGFAYVRADELPDAGGSGGGGE